MNLREGLRHRRTLVAALFATGVMLLAACGGSSGSSSNAAGSTASKNLFSGSGLDIEPPPPNGGTNPDAGLTPKRGGKVVYGLEADDTNGYCLPEAQPDISGEQIIRSVYDTLTVPGNDGKYHPYLAQAVTHSPDFKTWTIQLRPNIKFSDGSPLTAEVVKDNLDAYRGVYPARPRALLFRFVFSNVADVTVTGPLTVQVTTKVPWVDFDAFLFGQDRIGIMGLAQLNSPDHCFDHLIGTGPFTLKSWEPNSRYVLVRNPDYWQKAPDGQPYPYLDEIDYVPIVDESARITALESGQLNAMHTDNGQSIVQLRKLASDGKVHLITSVRDTEVGYLLLNATKPPFNDRSARLAIAEAVDYNAVNKTQGDNVSPLAPVPFAPNTPYYTTEGGIPRYNPTDAKKLVEQYKAAHGGQFSVVISSTPDDSVVRTVEQIQSYLTAAGISSKVQTYDQSQLINNAVSKNFQITAWRNHGGVDPDEQYVWWYGQGNPVNFNGFNDPVMNCLLDVGRSAADLNGCLKAPALNSDYPGLSNISPTDRTAIYQAVGREFGKQVWNVWGAYAPWTVATAPNVHGVFGPNLPDGSQPWQGLVNGNPVLGMWVS